MTGRRPIITDKYAQARALAIRRQNVQRHERAAKVHKLREELQRHTANRNRQFELDRLRAASIRHSGLDAIGLTRMKELEALVR